MDLKLNLASFSSSSNMLDTEKIYDVIIIGGGPAALNSALYAARKKMELALIAEEIGGQIVQSSSIENWLGDKELASSTLNNRFFEHIKSYDVPMLQNIKVTSMDLEEPVKKVSCSNGLTYKARAVIVATGKSPRPLGVPNEKELVGKGVAYCTTCDGPVYKDKKVVIVGGGNSGVEAALDMLNFASEVVVVQNLPELTADAVLADKLLADNRVKIVYSSICVSVEGMDKVTGLKIKNTETNEESIIPTDGIFVEIGLLPASGFVPDSVKNSIGEIEINADCSTNISGLYAAGDVTNVPFKQVIIAAGEGAKAALSVCAYVMSECS